jgi:hypothetical protein
MENLKAVHDIVGSSAETVGVFKTGFDTVSLHCPAVDPRRDAPPERLAPGAYTHAHFSST